MLIEALKIYMLDEALNMEIVPVKIKFEISSYSRIGIPGLLLCWHVRIVIHLE